MKRTIKLILILIVGLGLYLFPEQRAKIVNFGDTVWASITYPVWKDQDLQRMRTQLRELNKIIRDNKQSLRGMNQDIRAHEAEPEKTTRYEYCDGTVKYVRTKKFKMDPRRDPRPRVEAIIRTQERERDLLERKVKRLEKRQRKSLIKK